MLFCIGLCHLLALSATASFASFSLRKLPSIRATASKRYAHGLLRGLPFRGGKRGKTSSDDVLDA